MKTTFIWGAAALLLGVGIAGCNSTAQGLKQDTENNAQAVKSAGDKAAIATERAANNAAAATEQAAHNAKVATEEAAHNAKVATQAAAENTAAAVSKAGKNAGDALTLTPKVKLAIVNDSQLNNVKNLINVETADNVVHLKGTVISSEMKQRAGEIAQKTVKAARSNDTVSNELKVAPQ